MNKFVLTILVCLVCCLSARAQTPEIQARTQTALYVLRLQTKDGGFKSSADDPKATASLRATSSALRALRYVGGKLPDKAICEKFIASCFDPATGGFADAPGGKVDVLTTAVGLMAVVELGMPKDPYYAAAAKYLSDNAKTFDDVRIGAAAFESIGMPAPKEKEWRELVAKQAVPPATDASRAWMLASKVVTLLRLGDKAAATGEVAKELQKAQHANGGYARDEVADLDTTYRIMRALWMLKAKPASVDDMHNFIHKCRNADGGYAVEPGEASSISGTYYAAIIIYWLDGKK